jgi:hypothetical protein
MPSTSSPRKLLRTSKKASALRQLSAAIAHFHKDEFDCAITLAAAAEGILPPPEGHPYLFRQLKDHPSAQGMDWNDVINWLKHWDSGPDIWPITESEAILVIHRAINKFIAIYHQSTQELQDFEEWGREALRRRAEELERYAEHEAQARTGE